MKEKTFKFLGKVYHFSNSWTGTVIIVLFIIFFIAQAFRIPSGSMKYTLLIGDHVFAKKFAYGIPTPHLPFLEFPLVPGTDGHIYNGDKPMRGDIVIFRYPGNTKIHYVKRCVATGGDKLFLFKKELYLRPHEGDDFIKENYPEAETKIFNGELWVKNPYRAEHPGINNDPKIINDGRYPEELFNFAPIKVPEDEYFMMGDNRDHSNDSRFWGSVPYGLVEGTPWFVYFSMDDNWNVRWDRIGKSMQGLDDPELIKKARFEYKDIDKADHGIY
ncbi:MAG: signal peptidase I [Helicobacteraceae bacterium]|nr:signal peptidase I [Helicobacteraceae bacterium]